MPVISAIARHAEKPLDVHLMIENPDRYIQAFADLGSANLTVSRGGLHTLAPDIGRDQRGGMKAGVALNPHTPLHSIEEVLLDLDVVCLMSVNPGFGGQKFIPSTLGKVRRWQT